jgi:hypothetical protein
MQDVVSNALATEQMDGVKEKIETIYARYVQMWDEGFFPETLNVYDYTETTDPAKTADLDDIMEDIGDYLDYRRERAW